MNCEKLGLHRPQASPCTDSTGLLCSSGVVCAGVVVLLCVQASRCCGSVVPGRFCLLGITATAVVVLDEDTGLGTSIGGAQSWHDRMMVCMARATLWQSLQLVHESSSICQRRLPPTGSARVNIVRAPAPQTTHTQPRQCQASKQLTRKFESFLPSLPSLPPSLPPYPPPVFGTHCASRFVLFPLFGGPRYDWTYFGAVTSSSSSPPPLPLCRCGTGGGG